MGKIIELHELLRKKEISVKELTDKYLCKIDSLNPLLNAYVNVTAQQARLAAELADCSFASANSADLLCGIPMTLKDNISTKDIKTTCCSKILEDYSPLYDATAWQRLKTAGAVLLGKTNMDEFAMGSTTETSCFGSAKNPVNTDYVAGGSSGGSAAAVAAGLAVYALGSDTGGSVRQPAGFCGCVGLKPTYGAVSRFGLVAYASSLDQIGVLSSTVEDAAIVFDRISGFDPQDSTSVSDAAFDVTGFLNNDIKGKRLGIPQELLDKADKEVRDSVLKAAKDLEQLGAEVELFSMPLLVTALPAYYVIACAEASSNLGRYDGVRFGKREKEYESIHQMICKTRSHNFGDEVKKRILLGTFVLSEGFYSKYYAKAQSFRKLLMADFAKVFERFDALLTPTSPTTAFRSGQNKENKDTALNADLCTVSANLAGLPALSLPCGKDSKGLPIGLQLIGRRLEERVILNIANIYEKAYGNTDSEDSGVKL